MSRIEALIEEVDTSKRWVLSLLDNTIAISLQFHNMMNTLIKIIALVGLSLGLISLVSASTCSPILDKVTGMATAMSCVSSLRLSSHVPTETIIPFSKPERVPSRLLPAILPPLPAIRKH